MESSSVKRTGFWLRSCAALIDAIVLMGVIAVLALSLDAARAPTASEEVIGMTIIAIEIICSASEVILSATPGKWLLGLQIRSANADAAGSWRLFTRWSTKQCPLIMLCCSLRQIGRVFA